MLLTLCPGHQHSLWRRCCCHTQQSSAGDRTGAGAEQPMSPCVCAPLMAPALQHKVLRLVGEQPGQCLSSPVTHKMFGDPPGPSCSAGAQAHHPSPNTAGSKGTSSLEPDTQASLWPPCPPSALLHTHSHITSIPRLSPCSQHQLLPPQPSHPAPQHILDD